MYNVLIVDDEKIIREGVVELLSLEEHLELNLFSAPSAIDAKDILEQRKIDIVLTDIQMPKMSGLELMDLILERWPHCKVIFLTGYSDFDYVYKVQKHARYVLKAEDDEKIIDAVKEAIDEIENDFMVERIVQRNSQLVEQQKDLDRIRFMYDLLNGFVESSAVDQQFFDSLGITLDIGKDVYCLVIHHEYLLTDSYVEQLRILEDMQFLLNKYIFTTTRGISVHYSKNYIVVLLQPLRTMTEEYTNMMLKENGELFQRACLKNFSMEISIAIGSSPLPIGGITGGFQVLKAALLMSSDDESITTVDLGFSPTDDDSSEKDQKKTLLKSHLQLLDFYFENLNRERVIALITEALRMFENSDDMHDLFAVEVYGDIAVKLLTYSNEFRIPLSLFAEYDVNALYNFHTHTNWKDAFDYLISVADLLFNVKTEASEKRKGDVTERVKRYIQEHLNEDTSLETLADFVSLRPEYLSRLFKKSTGETVLHYINELKVIKAKKMIEDNDLQVKEIAFELGFSSSGYFGRFFKSKTGFSPQGYREWLEKNR